MQDFVPVLKLMAISGAQQSELPEEPREPVTIYEFNNRVYKRYQYACLLEDQVRVLELTNEYGVLRKAKNCQLSYVMPLDRYLLGTDHVALTMEKFDMTYREYLRSHKDTRQLAKILMDVGKGIKELQGIGYVHRDLKPENIVVNMRPLQVKIIDFNRSYSILQSTKGTVRGTPGYYPMG